MGIKSKQHSCIISGTIDTITFGNASTVPSKAENTLTYDPEILLLGRYPRKISTYDHQNNNNNNKNKNKNNNNIVRSYPCNSIWK